MQNENETEARRKGLSKEKEWGRGRGREREKRCPCVDLRIGTPVDATRNRLDDVKRRLDKRVALSHYEEKGLLPFFLASFLLFFLSATPSQKYAWWKWFPLDRFQIRKVISLTARIKINSNSFPLFSNCFTRGINLWSDFQILERLPFFILWYSKRQNRKICTSINNETSTNVTNVFGQFYFNVTDIRI